MLSEQYLLPHDPFVTTHHSTPALALITSHNHKDITFLATTHVSPATQSELGLRQQLT
jgi:hypothetical protein